MSPEGDTEAGTMDGLRFNTGTTNVTDNVNELRKSITSEAKAPSGSNSPGIGSSSGESFADSLKKAVNTVDSLQKDADVKMQELATGKSQNIHETMIAAEKADIALKLMVQVRNKIIDAYQEIMRMQV
ncbi:MAG: flagellar hook-basal body complex protein FliE [Bdellovibrionota bacterium]